MPLDPEVAAYLESRKLSPPRSALDVAGTRRMMRRAAALAGPAPPLARIEDMLLPGSLPARQYWPVLLDGLPIVVNFHGGRFFSGDLESHDALCRLLALSAGCRILAVDYRLAPERRFPAAAEDARIAVEWALREGVAAGVAGDSAGANLAAGAALAHRGPALRCQLLIYPMTCGGAGPSTSRKAPIRATRSHRRFTPTTSEEPRRRLSSPPKTTRCAMRARRTRASWFNRAIRF